MTARPRPPKKQAAADPPAEQFPDWMSADEMDRVFAAEYCRTDDAAGTFRRLFAPTITDRKRLHQGAARMLLRPRVRDEIARITGRAQPPTLVEADVLNQWITIATADPRELITHRRVACRQCWGADHAYQWVNEAELERAREAAAEHNERARQAGGRIVLMPTPSAAGGFGFTPQAEPHPNCPSCHGEGHSEVFLPDHRHLSPAAQLLLVGVKATRNGIEVNMRDRDGALNKIADYLGMLVKKAPGVGDDVDTPLGRMSDEELQSAIARGVTALSGRLNISTQKGQAE